MWMLSPRVMVPHQDQLTQHCGVVTVNLVMGDTKWLGDGQWCRWVWRPKGWSYLSQDRGEGHETLSCCSEWHNLKHELFIFGTFHFNTFGCGWLWLTQAIEIASCTYAGLWYVVCCWFPLFPYFLASYFTKHWEGVLKPPLVSAEFSIFPSSSVFAYCSFLLLLCSQSQECSVLLQADVLSTCEVLLCCWLFSLGCLPNMIFIWQFLLSLD